MTLTFPNLLEAKAVIGKNGKPTGEPKYSANFEFDAEQDDLKRFKQEAAKVAAEKWPGRELKTVRFPFANGDVVAEKAAAKDKDRSFSKGKVILTARSKYQPKLSIYEGGKLIDLEGEAAIAANARKFYSGVQILGGVTFVAYDGVNDGPDGVTAYLNDVVSLNRGKRLTGGQTAAEKYKDVVGSLSDVDPTVGADLDAEIPF